MRRTEALQGVRMIKFLSILGRYVASELSQLEAAELLGIGERTFRRWCWRYEEDGEAGLLDRRLAKCRASGFPATTRRRSRLCTGAVTAASPRSIGPKVPAEQVSILRKAFAEGR